MKSAKKKIWHQKVWYKDEVREKPGNRTKPLICVCLTALFFLTACGEKTDAVDTLVSDQPIGQSADSTADNWNNSVNASAENIVSPEELFMDRDFAGEYDEKECIKIELQGSTAQCSSDGVEISGSNVTITQEGVYLLTGELQDGMITVAAKDTDKVQLVLKNTSIVNSGNAAIYVKSADKVFLTLAAGSVNTLASTGGYVPLDGNNIDGTIFAKSDLTLNGTGSLEITAAQGHGAVSKDDLKVTGGKLTITADGHGLSGKDSVRIGGGEMIVTSGKDGIHSEHEDVEKGYIYLSNAELNITAGGDGISASGFAQIDGGSFSILAGGGSGNKTVVLNEQGETVSTKGIKVSRSLLLNNGVLIIDAQDDGLHSNENLLINGGEYQIASGDDGIHADKVLTVAGGKIDISQSYEGIEGNEVVVSGGEIRLYASDDGINAAGGRDQSGHGGFMGRDSFEESGNSSIWIAGGTIYVNADGDGVDSNGTFSVSGGELTISGPVDGRNGAIDYETAGQITGGKVIAAGSSGMAMNFGETSTQGSILLGIPQQTAGTEILLKDSAGNMLLNYTADKTFDSLVLSCPELIVGETYMVSAGEYEGEVTLEELITGNGFGGPGGFGGPRGEFEGPGGGPGGRGEGFEGSGGGPGGRGESFEGSGGGPGGRGEGFEGSEGGSGDSGGRF